MDLNHWVLVYVSPSLSPVSQVCVALQELLSTPIRSWPLSGCPLTTTTEEGSKEAWEAWEGWVGWVEEWEECPGKIWRLLFCTCFHVPRVIGMLDPHCVETAWSFCPRRYTFGPALFVAWIAGGVLVIGGILKSLAFREMVKDERTRWVAAHIYSEIISIT